MVLFTYVIRKRNDWRQASFTYYIAVCFLPYCLLHNTVQWGHYISEIAFFSIIHNDRIVDIQISIADDNLHKYRYLYHNFIQINHSNLKRIKNGCDHALWKNFDLCRFVKLNSHSVIKIIAKHAVQWYTDLLKYFTWT